MSEKKAIAEGDIVTVELDDAAVSNTYFVLRKLTDECVLSHPLAPECLIIKSDLELNNTGATMQSPLEKCLNFAKSNKASLGYTMAADLEALSYYFTIKKQFTPKQRADLANICGKIASVSLGNNVSAAVSTIKYNKPLLDEYNYTLCNSVKGVLTDPLSLSGKGQRYTVFNIAGFVLAQLEV